MRRIRPPRLPLAAQRRLFGFGSLGFVALATYWVFFSNGVPVIWGPSASASEITAGRDLFEHQWTPNDPLAHGDGLGPVYNAKSCASCHFQGGVGGGGGGEHNALGYEVAPRPNDPTFLTGTVHNFSVDPAQKESVAAVKKVYPVIKGRTETVTGGDPHCRYTSTITVPDFDPVRTDSVQPTALFGAGWVDLISDKAIRQNRNRRAATGSFGELSLKFTDVPVGRLRVVAGGVGKFGWKAQFATLEEFVAAACANELGLGTPTTEQAKPLTGPARSVVADSAPYLHDGSAATLKDAILRHRGDAKAVTEAYKALSSADQDAVVSFLKTLKAPPDAPQLRDPSVTKLAKR